MQAPYASFSFLAVRGSSVNLNSVEMAAAALVLESVWLHQQKHEEAEAFYQQRLAGTVGTSPQKGGGDKPAASSLVNEIAQARQNIHKVLHSVSTVGNASVSGADGQLLDRLQNLEIQNSELKDVAHDLQATVKKLEARICVLEKSSSKPNTTQTVKPVEKAPQEEDDDDDDIDLFGSDKCCSTDSYDFHFSSLEKEIIAKSSVILDIKPWDDETDMKALEASVRGIAMDGLVWAASKLVEVAFGVKKLQINCIVEDDKVGIDDLSDKITEDFDEYVQSVDVAAFNKI
ncbi:hypothetical protein ScPMuIL_007690 [Solemya velum]